MEYVLPEERLGRLMGDRYRLLHVLGEGATSIVYEADDARTGARVAVKVLRPELAVDDEAARRFAKEAKLSMAFSHPASARVVDFGADERSSWLALELVDGPALSDHLRLEGPLDADATIDLLLPLVDAVGAAHRRGAIHRDLKPSNVMLAELAEGRYFPKLVDFGLARLDDAPSTTTRGRLLGTPHYMSPEQAAGTFTLAPTVDVWALGVILFECVEGKRPFEGPSSTAVLMQVMRFEAPKVRRLPQGAPLAAVIARALARSPDERFPDGHALSLALVRARAGYAPQSKRRLRGALPLVLALGAGMALAYGAQRMSGPTPVASRGPAPVVSRGPAPVASRGEELPGARRERATFVPSDVSPPASPARASEASSSSIAAARIDNRSRRARASTMNGPSSTPVSAPAEAAPLERAPAPGIAVTRQW